MTREISRHDSDLQLIWAVLLRLCSISVESPSYLQWSSLAWAWHDASLAQVLLPRNWNSKDLERVMGSGTRGSLLVPSVMELLQCSGEPHLLSLEVSCTQRARPGWLRIFLRHRVCTKNHTNDSCLAPAYAQFYSWYPSFLAASW